MKFSSITASLISICFWGSFALADGPKDNNPLTVRAVPPAGIQLEPQVRQSLLGRCQSIRDELSSLKEVGTASPQIEVFPRAVEMTLATNMFYSDKDVEAAGRLLDEAQRRLQELGKNEGRLLVGISDPRLVVGGFQSEIDNSIQPFGVVLPEDFSPNSGGKYRLDVWLHGRGEKVSEVGFLNQRSTQIGQYAPPNTIVLHPYGRYSNAFKFAG